MVLVQNILPIAKSAINNTLFNKVTLQITLTSSYDMLAFFNLRQKVYRCIYTHFDIRKFYETLKNWPAITLNLNKKN